MVAVIRPLYPSLRPMAPADLAEVLAIELRAYDFPWNFGIFRECLRAGYSCWVLAHGAEIVGFGVLTVAAGEAHLLNLCVDPAYHGHGHGRRLLLRLIDLSRWHRVERIFLEVRPSNAAAIALYRDIGFADIGSRPNYYPARNGREDARVMALKLAAADDAQT